MYKFRVGNKIYNVSSDKLEKFQKEFPNAVLLTDPGMKQTQDFIVDGELYKIDAENWESFKEEFGNKIQTPEMYAEQQEAIREQKRKAKLLEGDPFTLTSWEGFVDWWNIDEDKGETQEKNTWIETLFGGKNQLTDFISDPYRAVKKGWAQGSDVTELGLLFNVKDRPLTEEEQKTVFEAMERQANLPVSDEMLVYMNSLPSSSNETFNMMNAVSGMSTSLIMETLISSMTSMGRALFEKEGLEWAAKFGAAGAATGAVVGAGIGAAAGSFAGGVGAAPGAAAGAVKGAIRGAVGGVMGGLGGVLEATGKVGELIRKEMYALGMEFNYENFKKFSAEHPDILEDISAKAITKGVTVAAIEGLFSSIVPGIGRFGSVGAKVLTKPLVRTGVTGFMEGTGGALGEYYSQKAIGEEASIKEVTLEAVGGGPITAYSVINQIKNPAKYSVDGVDASRETIWGILSNKKLTDQDIIDADIKVENDKVLENEIDARRNAFEKLTRLPKMKNPDYDPKKPDGPDNLREIDVISKEDRDKILEYETALEEAQNKKAILVEVGGKLINVQDLKQQVKDIYGKYEGQAKTDPKFGDVKTAKDVQDVLMETQEEFVKGKQKKAGLGFEAFDFADQFVGGVTNKISEIGVSIDEFLKVNKLNSIEDVGSADAIKFGDGTIFVNKQVAVETKTYDSVGSHEVLHNVVDNKFDTLIKENPKEGKKLIADFRKHLKSKLDRRTYNNIVKRLKRDYGFSKEQMETTVEWFTVFSDAVVNDKSFSEKSSIFKSLLKFFNKNVNKHTEYKNLDFGNVENMYEWIKTYSKDVKAGKERTDVETLIDVGEPTAKMAASRSKAVDAVNEMEQGAKTKAEFQKPGIFNKIYNSIIQENGAINNYVKSLGLSKEKFQETIDALGDRLMNYDPAAKRKTDTGEPITVGEFLMANIGFGKLVAAKKLAIEGKRTDIERATDLGETTKEGDIKIQAKDTDTSQQDTLDAQDLSPAGIAKTEAKVAAAKKKRYSKLRQELGFETDGDTYNAVLDATRKSLILAYKKTLKITDPKARVDAIVELIKKEYNSLTSDLFKPLKNFLGVKEYLNNLKKFRVPFIEVISTADLVQMERNVPDSERVFTRFVKELTSKQEVQDAVNQNKLPKDALNVIDKGQSVNLYEKVMPTDNEIVGFADQPAINPETGQRSGLKGTRKDGFAKRIAESLIFDAVMEVRQDPDVQKTLTEDLNAQMDVKELASKIGRDVSVRFSKSRAAVDINSAIDMVGDVNVYLQARFSKSHADQYNKRLIKKRPDLSKEQRENAIQSIFNFVDDKNIPNNKKSKFEKLSFHYLVNGNLILPEDGYKVIEVERLAAKNKIDPFSVKDPNALMQKYTDDSKVKRTDPDKVKTFSNKTEYSSGVVVYDVKDSKQGQLDVRKVADTHFGPKFQGWCIIHRSKEEIIPDTEIFDIREEAESMKMVFEETGRYETVEVISYNANLFGATVKQYAVEATPRSKRKVDLLSNSFENWEGYNTKGNGFKIAFHNGKLVAFRDGNKKQWWDINDKSTPGVVIKSKPNKEGFKTVTQVQKNKETILHHEKGSSKMKNGVHIIKSVDGDITTQTPYKNGKEHGVSKNVSKDGAISESTTENGKLISWKVIHVNNLVDLIGRNLDRGEVINADGESIGGLSNLENIKLTIDGNVETIDNNNIINSVHKVEATDKTTGESITYVEASTSGRITERSFNGEQFLFEADVLADPIYFEGVTKEKFNIPVHEAIAAKKKDALAGYDSVEAARNSVVRFSRSIKFSLSELEQNRKTLPAILKRQSEVKKRMLKNPMAEDLYLLDRLSDLEFAIENNLNYEEAFAMFQVNLPEDVSSLLVDFKDINSFESYIQDVSVPAIRTLGLNAAKTYFKNKFNSLTTDKQKVDLVIKFLKNIGISVRGDAKALEVSFTNQRLLEGPVTEIFGEKFVNEHFKFAKIKEGEKKGKTIRYSYDGKDGIFEKVELYTDIENIKNSRGDTKVVKQVNKEAKEANEFIDEIIDSDLSISERLAIIDLLSLNQRGAIRKSYTFGETVTDKVTKSASELVLEHEITVKNMTKYLRQRVKGILTQEQLVEIRSQAKVHVWETKIDDILNAEKTTDGKSLRYEGGRSRYQNDKVKNYLTSQFEKGLITNIPVEIKEVSNLNNLIRFSRSTKNPTKGISILDFDDTLATTKSLIRFTRPDGTKGTLTPEQYAGTYEDLLGLDYKFDFSEFNKVVDGKPAPLLEKAKKLAKKFGTNNMFILTARPSESAVAIQKFLKENGLNIPLKNITGLGNSTAQAKALWVLDKAAEGYNDFYFADDAIQNVKAVQNMLDQIDVKSKVQQAIVKFSKSMDNDFNNILEDVVGIDAKKRFSDVKAKRRGKGKGRFRFFVPPSHEDFIGLLYNFMGKGKKGDKHRKFFEKALIKPLNRAYRELNATKQAIASDYKALIKESKDIRKKLSEKILDGDYTHEDAIRVYLWDKAGFKIPGLSKIDQKNLVDFIKSDPEIQEFADKIGIISQDKNGYVQPGENWDIGGIKWDLIDATGRIGRAKFFQEFIENSSIIFSEENLNKIEAIHGEDFRSALEDMLYRVNNGTNRPTGRNKLVNRWIDWINGSVGATMFFNTRSAILQQLSFVNFMNFADNNIFKAAARFADQKQFWIDFAMIFNSDYLKQRRSGAGFDVSSSEIAREVSNAKDPISAAIRYILNKGFLPTQMGDSFAIAIGGASFYRNRVNTYLKQINPDTNKKYTQKEAEAKAFIDFMEIAEATQQSARPDMISQQQSSVLGRFILAFQNVTSQYTRIVKKSTLDLIKRRKSPGYVTQKQSDMANVSRIIYYGAIQSIIFYGLQTALFAMMFDDDEQDEEFFDKKRDRILNGTLDSFLRGTGILGAVVSTVKNYGFKLWDNSKSDDYFKSPAWVELLQISPPIGIKVRKLISGERTIDWNMDVMKEMEFFDIDNPIWDAVTNITEAAFNVPLNRLHRKVQNIRAASNAENAYWQRIAMALGWNKWDVGVGPGKDVEEAKERIKQDKKEKKKTKGGTRDNKENKKREEENKKKSKKDGICSAISRSGNRCRKKVESGSSYCTIHEKVQQNKSGKKTQCKKMKQVSKNKKERCKMETSSKSGYCYYHD